MRFKCVGWPCSATFIFSFSRHTWCSNAGFGAQVSSKYGTWYSERVILQFLGVGSWGDVSISLLHSADESQERRNSCNLMRSCFMGSCHVGVHVLKSLSRTSISLACSPSLKTVTPEILAMPQRANYCQITVQRVCLYFCHIIFTSFFNF